MYRGAIIGNPVEHSLSPDVFDMFAQETGIPITYEKILAKDSLDFNDIVTNFFNDGGTVLTITSPFKQDAFKIAKTATARAKFCEAANFLRLNDGRIEADTTDGIGILRDIEENNNFKLFGKNILIIGSGFVLDSILLDLIVANPLSIDILARNKNRVEFLSRKFATGEFQMQKKYDFILNTVPNSSENGLLKQINSIKTDSLCYEMAYSNFVDNKFNKYIKNLNPEINVLSGIGMLVEQAEVVFNKLFNVSPNTSEVIKKLAISN